jgi:hypothetical protein
MECLSLTESLAVLQPSGPRAGSDSLKFFVPSAVSPGLAPYEDGCRPNLGSAFRFSQPQRFPSRPKLRGLVSYRNHSWDLVLQSFPLAGKRAPLSRPPAPLWLSTDVLGRTSRGLVTARFTDVHAFAQLPGSPNGYGSPFGSSDDGLPGRPGSRAAEPSRSTGFTHFEALFLLASPFSPARVAPSRLSLLSWTSSPLELSPFAPWIL